MKKLFVSADIEGTCGIASWNETDEKHAEYGAFAAQMTYEVAAACQGALDAGWQQILVKDAHGSARNIDGRALPEGASLVRGWGNDPLGMMLGLDESFDGVVMTGYHAAAGMADNPLAHTWSLDIHSVHINGELASEMLINSLIAAWLRVPVYAVSGDQGICDWMKQRSPNTAVIPVNQGVGGAVKALHPEEALRQIRQKVSQALTQPREACLFPLPERFQVDICYQKHQRARHNSFYPGMQGLDARTLRYEHADFEEVLRMFHFCL